eukprot:3680423-Rhodomonas_salina.3
MGSGWENDPARPPRPGTGPFPLLCPHTQISESHWSPPLKPVHIDCLQSKTVTRPCMHMTSQNGSARKGGHGRHAPQVVNSNVVKANDKVLLDMLLSEAEEQASASITDPPGPRAFNSLKIQDFSANKPGQSAYCVLHLGALLQPEVNDLGHTEAILSGLPVLMEQPFSFELNRSGNQKLAKVFALSSGCTTFPSAAPKQVDHLTFQPDWVPSGKCTQMVWMYCKGGWMTVSCSGDKDERLLVERKEDSRAAESAGNKRITAALTRNTFATSGQPQAEAAPCRDFKFKPQFKPSPFKELFLTGILISPSRSNCI